MRENSSWSLNWGTWAGVRVRAHASLFGVFVLMVYFSEVARHGWIGAPPYVAWYGPMSWLILLNLIPAPPPDAGRGLRAVMWPVMGHRGASRTLSRCGMLTALALCLIGVLLYDPQSSRPLPAWLPLLALSIYLYFASRQDS